MIKKVISVVLTVAIVLTMCSVVFAGEYTDSLIVDGDMMIRESGGTYQTTDLTISKSSSQDFPTFDLIATLYMKEVRDMFKDYIDSQRVLIVNLDKAKAEEAETKLENMKITGSFVITITFPDTITIPESFKQNGNMVGFSDATKKIFGNDVRTLDGTDTMVITVSIVGEDVGGTRQGYVLMKDLEDNIEEYLPDLTLECEGIKTSEYGTVTVKGKMNGKIVAKGRSTTLTVDYNAQQLVDSPSSLTTDTIEASVTVKSRGSSGNRVEDTKKTTDDSTKGSGETVSLSYIIGDKKVTKKVTPNSIVGVEEMYIPYREGYRFVDWYYDEELTKVVDKDFTVPADMNLYPKWEKIEEPTNLNSADHFAYIKGYPDGTVRPENNITREEITTIFYRILKDEYRNSIYKDTNSFPDVEKSRWSNVEISTIQNAKIINGYEDGLFRPEQYITRAEFSKIASLIEGVTEETEYAFSDIKGHWAEKYIKSAISKGWIAGYEDGTFKPDQFITRAEAMTIVNRMLNRFFKGDGLDETVTAWPDNPKSEWYYYIVLEATNSHDYSKDEQGVYETWVNI